MKPDCKDDNNLLSWRERILGECLSISSLSGKALRMLVDTFPLVSWVGSGT